MRVSRRLQVGGTVRAMRAAIFLETGQPLSLEDVTRVRPGQRVIIALTPVCGKCWFCLHQETHLCEMFGEVFARKRAERADGSTANAMSGVGSFSDMMTVDEAQCVPVETDLPADQLALI